MSIRSKIKAAVSRVTQSAKSFAGWFSRGYIITKLGQIRKRMGETFGEATHGGYLSSGMVRSDDQNLAVYMSDVDGTDIAVDFKSYIESLNERYPDSSPAIKVFTASGVLGMYARTELTYVMIYGGIPYIMPVHRSLEGIDEHDTSFSSSINRLITTLSNNDANHVISLGFVDQTVNVNEYVLEYAKKSPLFDSAEIDPHIVKIAIHEGTIKVIGSLYLPGGYLYDIYAIEPLLSRTFRPYRDFTQAQDQLPAGREVLLVGGDPDIVFVGTQSSPDGFLYDVWVPNDARYYNRAKAVVANEQIPMGNMVIDDDEYLESYAILLKILRELDEEANGPQEETSPDILVNPDEDGDTDTDEVPVLIDLPEYLS